MHTCTLDNCTSMCASSSSDDLKPVTIITSYNNDITTYTGSLPAPVPVAALPWCWGDEYGGGNSPVSAATFFSPSIFVQYQLEISTDELRWAYDAALPSRKQPDDTIDAIATQAAWPRSGSAKRQPVANGPLPVASEQHTLNTCCWIHTNYQAPTLPT